MHRKRQIKHLIRSQLRSGNYHLFFDLTYNEENVEFVLEEIYIVIEQALKQYKIAMDRRLIRFQDVSNSYEGKCGPGRIVIAPDGPLTPDITRALVDGRAF